MRSALTTLFFTGILIAGNTFAEAIPKKIGVFQQEIAKKFTQTEGLPSGNVLEVLTKDNDVIAVTTAGWAHLVGDKWQSIADNPSVKEVLAEQNGNLVLQEWPGEDVTDDTLVVRQAAGNPDMPVALATANGLYLRNDAGAYEKADVRDGMGREWGVDDVRGVAVDSNGHLWFATLAGAACRMENGWKFFTGNDGLPYNDFTCMVAGSDGAVWFGTKIGAIRTKTGNGGIVRENAGCPVTRCAVWLLMKMEASGLPRMAALAGSAINL